MDHKRPSKKVCRQLFLGDDDDHKRPSQKECRQLFPGGDDDHKRPSQKVCRQLFPGGDVDHKRPSQKVCRQLFPGGDDDHKRPGQKECRQLFPGGDDEHLKSINIEEELRKYQNEFKKKYNFDPVEGKPLPGRYVYNFDEEKGFMIGRLTSTDTDTDSLDIQGEFESTSLIVEVKEADASYVNNKETPKNENQ